MIRDSTILTFSRVWWDTYSKIVRLTTVREHLLAIAIELYVCGNMNNICHGDPQHQLHSNLP